MNSDQVLDEDLNAKLISFLILSFHTVSKGYESLCSNLLNKAIFVNLYQGLKLLVPNPFGSETKQEEQSSHFKHLARALTFTELVESASCSC